MILMDTLVVTATLGDRESLKRTVNSVKEIGGERVKHVIICPLKNCKSVEKIFPDLEIIPEPENCNGIYPALNYGLKKYANDYKYLTYINDDDYWLPNYKDLFSILDKAQNVDVAYGKTDYVNEKNIVIGEQTSSSRYKAFKVLLSQNIVLFTQQATLMKSDLFIKLGGYDESFKLIADSKFWVEAIDSNAKFEYTNTCCAAYTIQEGQLSSNKELQSKEHIRLFENIEKANVLDRYIEKYIFRFLNLNIYIKRIYNKGSFKSSSNT
jgi:hypothetical protein